MQRSSASCRVAVAAGRDCSIELFVLPMAPGSPLQNVAVDERAHDEEAHVALSVVRPDIMTVSALHSIFSDYGWMHPDGGGYNGWDVAVLYFRRPHARSRFLRRVERLLPGHHPAISEAHLRRSVPPAERLLALMTGASTTQAISVAAELQLADRLDARPGTTVAELDWGDELCVTILSRIASAMPDHARLLIVERLLPEDQTRSLAFAWDIHMLCNVGGRERTAAQYCVLLADAGLRLTACRSLPLDFSLLIAETSRSHVSDDSGRSFLSTL